MDAYLCTVGENINLSMFIPRIQIGVNCYISRHIGSKTISKLISESLPVTDKSPCVSSSVRSLNVAAWFTPCMRARPVTGSYSIHVQVAQGQSRCVKDRASMRLC